MSRLRVAMVYDDTVRPDTTGLYCKRAMSCLADVTHILPSELRRLEAEKFDIVVNVDDGLRYRLPCHANLSALWAIDTHLDFEWYVEKAPDFDFVFAAQKDGAAQLSARLGRDVCWLPLACDPAFHRVHQQQKKWNIGFIGSVPQGPRADLIHLLERRFDDVLVDRRYFDDMAKAYSESRVVFNRSVRNDINMRVFESVGCGAFLLTNDLQDNGLAELFDVGTHLETYHSADELLDKVAFYLSHETARDRVSAAGRRQAYAQHTYRQRMAELLRIVMVRDRPTTESVLLPRSYRPNSECDDITSIVIPTFNQLEFTRLCLDSVRANTSEPFEIIVVDNGSTDGTVEYLEDCPDVVLVCNRTNRGFPVAVNQGMRMARGSRILLLNNDTIVPSGWLSRLRRPLADSAVGLVGPLSNCVSGRQQIGVSYRSPAELEQFTVALAKENWGVIEETDRLVGFCLLIDRRVVDAIGYLDEGFGMGCFEDDDYTLRARQAGFKAVMARDAFVHHFGSQTFLNSGLDFTGLMERNRKRFQEKWANAEPAAKSSVESCDVKDSPAPVAPRPKILVLAHLEFLASRLDRSQYLRYVALQRQGATLFGPGAEGYRAGISLDAAIGIACQGVRPDWILHGMDIRASGVPIVTGLDESDIPTAYEFGDSWTMRDAQAHFVNLQKFQIAFLLATRDLAFYRQTCPHTEFMFLPNAIDTSIFYPRRVPKTVDVLVYGSLDREVYPLRARICDALAKQSTLRLRHIAHPGYYPEGGWNGPGVIAGESLAGEISAAWCAIATSTAFDVLLMKHLEIAACGTLLAGTLPIEGRAFFGDSYLDLSRCDGDAAIIDAIASALHDKQELQSAANQAYQFVRSELSTEHYATRVAEILADWATSSARTTTMIHDEARPSHARRLGVSKQLATSTTSKNRPRLSLCMIVRNNEQTLDACLSSIKPWVDEIVVVDTGSSDRTSEIAGAHGAQVFSFPWPDSFAIARNESLGHATGEWVFWMDSDDTISQENGEKLRALLANEPPEHVLGYILQVHCPGDSLDGDDDATVVDHVKVFRNRPDLRFEGRIHEQIMPAIRRAGGEVVWTDIFVEHSGSDRSQEGKKRKQQRDMHLLELERSDHPESSFVHFNIGMTYADMDDHEAAITALRRCVALSIPSESHLRKAYALLTACHCHLRQFDEAERVCRSGLLRFPEDVELLFREGFIAHHLGHKQQSVLAYRRALAAEEPRHFSSVDRGLSGYKTRHNLALVYEDEQEFAMAEDQWRLVVAEAPSYRLGWRGLINNLVRQRKYQRAASEADRLAKTTGNRLEALELQAQVAKASGDVESSRALLETALSYDGENRDLLNQLCQLLFEFSEPRDAEPYLRELTRIDAENGANWHNLAITYLRMKSLQAAVEAFHEAIRLRPESDASYLYLGCAYRDLGDIDNAKAAWRTILARNQSPDSCVQAQRYLDSVCGNLPTA